MKDTYKGESWGKRHVRAEFWINTLFRLLRGKENPRVLVLAGRTGGDVNTLRGLEVDPKSIVAVDQSPEAAELFAKTHPDIEICVGDVEKVLSRKKFRRRFDVVLLDFCGPLSDRMLAKMVRCAALGIRNGGVLGCGFMYGRERSETVKRWIRHAQNVCTSAIMIASPQGRARLHPDILAFAKTPGGAAELRVAADDLEHVWRWYKNAFGREPTTQELRKAIRWRARVEAISRLMAQKALDMGFVLRVIDSFRYVSVTDAGKGIPMVYTASRVFRPFRHISRRALIKAALRSAKNDVPWSVGEPGWDDLEKNKRAVKYACIRWGAQFGAARAGLIYNVPKMTVAGWLAHDTQMKYDDEDPALFAHFGLHHNKDVFTPAEEALFRSVEEETVAAHNLILRPAAHTRLDSDEDHNHNDGVVCSHCTSAHALLSRGVASDD